MVEKKKRLIKAMHCLWEFLLHSFIGFIFINTSPWSIWCSYSSEASHRGASNEYPQHVVMEKPEINVVMEKPEINVVMEKPGINVVMEKPEINVVMDKPEINVVTEKPEINVVMEKPEINVVMEKPEMNLCSKLPLISRAMKSNQTAQICRLIWTITLQTSPWWR